jgi:hypothetical protein
VEYCPGIRAQHGVGTAPIRDVAVEVGAVPASPNPPLLIVCRKQSAARIPARAGSLWICGQRKSVAHIPTGNNSNSKKFKD